MVGWGQTMALCSRLWHKAFVGVRSSRCTSHSPRLVAPAPSSAYANRDGDRRLRRDVSPTLAPGSGRRDSPR